jgi:hypothetical protein
MTEKEPTDIFASLNVSKILVAILEIQKEITIPSSSFIDAATEDKELQVDYDLDSQSFKFKLKGKDGSGFNNDQLIESFE